MTTGYMNKDFDDIDNDMMALFLEDMLSDKEQRQVTNSIKTYKDLWLLAIMYHSKRRSD